MTPPVRYITRLCALCVMLAPAGAGAEDLQVNGAEMTYVGDATRMGIGLNSDGHVHGELLKVFGEDAGSAWIGEAWYSDESGGLKLNYHWQGGAGVNKAFIAWDRNEHDDRKLSLGLGRENADWFFGGYASRALTGERWAGSSAASVADTLSGNEGGRDFIQPRITTTTTEVYEHPYDWGVGGRLGRYFDDRLLRVRGGLDVEWGEASARQITLSLGLEKFFKNSPHSVSLTGEVYRKGGDFEDSDNDGRVLLVWRYEFGQSYRPRQAYRQVEVVHPAEPVPAKTGQRLVQHDVSVESDTLFGLNSSLLTQASRDLLDGVLAKIGQTGHVGPILITGHTCDLGPEAYNQWLSERRAQRVSDYLQNAGVPAQAVVAEGKGELEPRVPNTSEANRRQNRRVEIRFMTTEEAWETVEIEPAGMTDPRVEWKQEPVEQEPAWLRRALRNPIQHKRSVDYYRIEKERVDVMLGEREFLNRVPEAADDSFSVAADSAANLIDVLANDTDPDGEQLTIESVTVPSHGTASIQGDKAAYTPAPGFVGEDSFTYTASDGKGGSDSATVTVTVNAVNGSPVAQEDHFQTVQDQAVEGDVLGNDSDPDGDALTLMNVGQPLQGSAQIVGNGRVRYTPAVGFFGTDQFTYTVSDGRGGEATGTVTVEVAETNAAPQAGADSATVVSGATVAIDVLANDSDADGDALHVQAVSQPANGTVNIAADDTLSYRSSTGFTGVDTFVYTVADTKGATDTATVTVTVTRVNQVPQANDDSALTSQGNPVTVNVLANDSDPDGDTLTVSALGQPGHGSVADNGNGTVTYTPESGFSGLDSFTYTVSDGFGGFASAVVSVNVMRVFY